MLAARPTATSLAATIITATTPPQITAACTAIGNFLTAQPPIETRPFFTHTFPALIVKLFGVGDPTHPTTWIQSITDSNDSTLSTTLFELLSPNSILINSILEADRVSLLKYLFPIEILPQWMRILLHNVRDVSVLAELCPLFRGRVFRNGLGFYELRLNLFEFYLFWFAFYPVLKRNVENVDEVKVTGSDRFNRLENWVSSIQVLKMSNSGGTVERNECKFYLKLLNAYLREYVCVSDLSVGQQPYDDINFRRSEFMVHTLINFWLVGNDFSPLAVNVCKPFGLDFSFQSVVSEMSPTAGLGEVVNVFVKYLNKISMQPNDGFDRAALTESLEWRISGNVGIWSVGSWNSLIQRPLYRFIVRTFMFYPLETSIKDVSEVFSLWTDYMEPWTISFEDVSGLDANAGMLTNVAEKEAQSTLKGYSSSWQEFVLINYLFYSSLVVHFLRFAHKFVHTDTEAIVQMVLKVVSILTSSSELINLIKNVDSVFHSKPFGSSKSVLNNLKRFVPSIREQLQDWEEGLWESDADGSFLHESGKTDLLLFSDSDYGGKQLLQLFVLRAELELQAIQGDNLLHNMARLDSLKLQMGCLFGNSTLKNIPVVSEAGQKKPRNYIFKPKVFGNRKQTDRQYKGDWMNRPISNDEIAWLAKLVVTLSCWLNEILGLNHSDNTNTEGAAWSYVRVSEGTGHADTMKVTASSFCVWLVSVAGAITKFMRGHGMRVNLRILASKQILMLLLVVVSLSVLKRAVFKCKIP
ncbi:Transcription factor MYB82-like [Heracleum sosnowskyi]|uniref:Transcription factor MYB82-like n=1 Tax=Heracleum sosnowskyi TaxID=360622 RepID=A0AAD8I3V0_9APIA|nr:Transcription factor MYB82-like [Heracleum sosnowskyi]